MRDDHRCFDGDGISQRYLHDDPDTGRLRYTLQHHSARSDRLGDATSDLDIGTARHCDRDVDGRHCGRADRGSDRDGGTRGQPHRDRNAESDAKPKLNRYRNGAGNRGGDGRPPRVHRRAGGRGPCRRRRREPRSPSPAASATETTTSVVNQMPVSTRTPKQTATTRPTASPTKVTAPDTGVGTMSDTNGGVEWLLVLGAAGLAGLALVLAGRRRRV